MRYVKLVRFLTACGAEPTCSFTQTELREIYRHLAAARDPVLLSREFSICDFLDKYTRYPDLRSAMRDVFSMMRLPLESDPARYREESLDLLHGAGYRVLELATGAVVLSAMESTPRTKRKRK